MNLTQYENNASTVQNLLADWQLLIDPFLLAFCNGTKFYPLPETKNMAPDQNTRPSQTDDKPLAETGNASNPSPHSTETEPMNDNRLLSEDAEKYLREAGNIEDMPDAQDEADADKASTKKG